MLRIIHNSLLCSLRYNYTHANIKKTVLVSKSKDIFTNLALEDWLYRNFNFKSHHLLLLWQSDPCVVIGRHQNPFLEANVSELKNITSKGVLLSRRNSGGGTVYHDNGNLNLSFLTTKECYSRKYNLEIIAQAVYKEYGITININQREDLVIDDHKVSGTAAKLGRPNAYHHCTLLVNVNKKDLSNSLQKLDLNIHTNAMKSVRSKIMNLSERNHNVKIENLIKAIGIQYMQTPAFQGKNKDVYHNSPRGFKFVEPSDEEFPGISEIRKNLMCWKWIFGKTPKFTITHQVELQPISPSDCKLFLVNITVEDGIICDIQISTLGPPVDADLTENITKHLMSKSFDLEVFENVKYILNDFGNSTVELKESL